MVITEYKEAWKDSLFSLYRQFEQKQFCGESGERYWNWRAQKGILSWFDELSYPWLCIEDDKVCGTMNALPNVFRYRDNFYNTLVNTDLYINPPFTGLGASLVYNQNKCVDLVTFCNGSKEALALFLKARLKPIEPGLATLSKRLFKPALAVLKRAADLVRTQKSITTIYHEGYSWGKTTDMRRVENVSERFLKDLLKGYRSNKYMLWRVVSHPGGNFETWVCADSSATDIGYCIFQRIRRKNIAPYQMVIFDFGLTDDSKLDAEHFIRQIENLAARVSCDIVTFIILSPWQRFLDQSGYLKTSVEPFLEFSKLLDIPPSEKWHLTLLDTEKFLYPR